MTPKTKIIYRSLSANTTILVIYIIHKQMEVSKEIFEFDKYGDFYYDKMKRFINIYFQRN